MTQSIDIVLIINNLRGLKQLVKNQFKVGAHAWRGDVELTIRQDRDPNERFCETGLRTGQIVFAGMSGAQYAANTWKAAQAKFAK